MKTKQVDFEKLGFEPLSVTEKLETKGGLLTPQSILAFSTAHFPKEEGEHRGGSVQGGDGSFGSPFQLSGVTVIGFPSGTAKEFFGADGRVYSYENYPEGFSSRSKVDCPGCQFFDAVNNPVHGGPVFNTLGEWVYRDIPHYFGLRGHKKK